MAIQEILSANKNRAYPFEEDSLSENMPNWVLLDVRLVNTAFSGRSEDSSLSCTSFSVDSDSMKVSFVYSTTHEEYGFEVDIAARSDISVGTVDVHDGITATVAVYGGIAGEFDRLRPGTYSENIKVLKTKIIEIDAISKLRSICGVSGIVHVVDGHNTDARIVDGNVVVTVGKGLGLGADCNVPDDAFDCTKALLFINGQHADTSGNINIVGGTGVVVQTGRTARVEGSVVPAIMISHDGKLKEML